MIELVPCADDGAAPFGCAWLTGERVGVDLASHGYREDEFLVRGSVELFRYGHDWERTLERSDVSCVTRILVRQPVDTAAFSGVVHVEPLHFELERGLSWNALAPYLIRTGQAYVGVTVFHTSEQMMRQGYGADRYARLSISDTGIAFDLLRQLIPYLRDERIALPPVRRVHLSGWSATGSLCRTFVREGFAISCRTRDGAPAVDGCVIGISNGARGFLGYMPLSEQSGTLPDDDPRRTMRAPGIPVIELFSEHESETAAGTVRDDGDDPGDQYRLYEVAGSGHSGGPAEDSLTTGVVQLQARGTPRLRREIMEPASDLRRDYLVRAVFDRLDRWAREGQAPPRVAHLQRRPAGAPGPRGLRPDARPLVRDAHGNAVGGLRSPWLDVPVATYLPHSTPKPGACDVPPIAPVNDPAAVADYIGHRQPLSEPTLRELYGSAGGFAAARARSAQSLCDGGWLLAPEAEQIMRDAEREPVVAFLGAGLRPGDPHERPLTTRRSN